MLPEQPEERGRADAAVRGQSGCGQRLRVMLFDMAERPRKQRRQPAFPAVGRELEQNPVAESRGFEFPPFGLSAEQFEQPVEQRFDRFTLHPAQYGGVA